jgi:hypothetical protein
MSIYQQAGTRSWDKPAVYKIRPDGLWWATYRDQHGKYHSDMFQNHADALNQAIAYANGAQQ